MICKSDIQFTDIFTQFYFPVFSINVEQGSNKDIGDVEWLGLWSSSGKSRNKYNNENVSKRIKQSEKR